MTTVDVNVLDNQIDQSLREEVWEYINNQLWYATYKQSHLPAMSTYVPSRGYFLRNSHQSLTLRQPNMWMHRTCFASDEYGLEKDHPVIWKLWKVINHALGNKYVIEGPPEDMSVPSDDKAWIAPPTQNPKLEQGWRVYVNGQLDETIKRSHGVHRDTAHVNDNKTRTILYVANLEWYPTWFGECVFYPDDPDGTTGDHQQFQKGYGQVRNFKVGWADNGKIVSSVPGRIVDYDSRTLHTTRPTAVWAPDIRKTIAFRVRSL